MADAMRIKLNLDKNLKNDCKRMLNEMGRKIYYYLLMKVGSNVCHVACATMDLSMQ